MTVLPPALRDGLDLVVTEVHRYSERLVSLRMQAADERSLPSYVPGSHLALACGAGINAYSLTGSGLYPEGYAVSVRLDDAGAGGSLAMHQLRAGDVLRSSRPRSQFAPVAQARRHLLLAGGIGVTPICPTRALRRSGERTPMCSTSTARVKASMPLSCVNSRGRGCPSPASPRGRRSVAPCVTG